MSRFLEKFALNSEYALAEIRRTERERAGQPRAATGLNLRGLATRRCRRSPCRRNGERRDVGIRTLGGAVCGAGLSFRHRAERLPQEQGRVCSSPARRRSRSPTARAATACSSPSRASTCRRSTSRRTRWPRHGRWPKSAASRSALEQADLDKWPWPTGEFDVVAAIFFQFCAPPVRARGVRRHQARARSPAGCC